MKYILTLTLILGSVLSSTLSWAQNSNMELTESISLNINPALRGQYLIALYTRSTDSPINFNNASKIKVEKITGRVSEPIISSNVTLKPIALPIEPNFQTYNNIIFVVSINRDFVWVNADGSAVKGVQPQFSHPSQYQTSHVKIFNRKTIQENKALNIP